MPFRLIFIQKDSITNINKLDVSSNFQAWKKRIDLVLIENEVMDHILGKVIEPKKDKAQELVKYNKGEVRTQSNLIESIKYYLSPFVVDLGASKAI